MSTIFVIKEFEHNISKTVCVTLVEQSALAEELRWKSFMNLNNTSTFSVT
jgi:hypothetical protein